MPQWRVEFTVNGIRTQSIVCAYTSTDAVKLLGWQYYGQRVNVITYTRL